MNYMKGCKVWNCNPCNFCGQKLHSVLLSPDRTERHRTRCKYVIRCNMMAVIIRVFYDHGMNFPLKAPTRAYYLVTRYHVNGKATRLYKARYLENYKVLEFINQFSDGFELKFPKLRQAELKCTKLSHTKLGHSNFELKPISAAIVINWIYGGPALMSSMMPPHQWCLLINDASTSMMPLHQWCYSSTLPPYGQSLLMENAYSSTKLPNQHRLLINNASSTMMPLHQRCFLINDASSWMMPHYQWCLSSLMTLSWTCVGCIFLGEFT